ncbi:LOW QUALITY PROTEIN: hypothetical protein ACG7TL_008388 [Trametes sanguinea]
MYAWHPPPIRPPRPLTATMLLPHPALLALALALALLRSTLAASTSTSPSATTQKQNITVDDTAGSADGSLHIAYAPADAWRTGPACGTRCLVAGVDARRVRNGTWHEAAYDSARPRQITATLLFEGSDVYVYGLIPHTNATATNSVYLSYALDAPSPGGFVNASAPFPGDGTVAYDVPLLALTGLAGLPHALHNLTLVVGAAGDAQLSGPAAPSSVLLLDYLVVTQERSTAKGTSSARARASAVPSSFAAAIFALFVPIFAFVAVA